MCVLVIVKNRNAHVSMIDDFWLSVLCGTKEHRGFSLLSCVSAAARSSRPAVQALSLKVATGMRTMY